MAPPGPLPCGLRGECQCELRGRCDDVEVEVAGHGVGGGYRNCAVRSERHRTVEFVGPETETNQPAGRARAEQRRSDEPGAGEPDDADTSGGHRLYPFDRMQSQTYRLHGVLVTSS